jgi:putative acetyltransferase
VRLRPATVEDVPALAAILRVGLRGVLPHVPDLHTPAEDRAFLATQVLPRCTVHVGEEDGTVAGFIAFRPGWIDHLYVLPAFRGQGLGTRLLALACATHPRLELWTFQRNAGARRFYERHGFLAVRETDGAGNEEREPDVLYAWTSGTSEA